MAFDLKKLEKGERIDIGLQHLKVGLRWKTKADLDASAFMLGANGKVVSNEYFVFYGNKEAPDKSLWSSGDDTTGDDATGDDGDNETLFVQLDKVSPEVQEIIFVVTIYEGMKNHQNFGQVRNAYMRIVDADTDEEICRYELDEDFSTQNEVEFGRLYRRHGTWRFEAMGNGGVCTGEKGLEDYVAKYT